jgi:hypothetical protein
MSDESAIDSEKVYARPLRRILFVALFGLIALMAMMVMTSEPAEAVVIAGPVTWNTPQTWAEDVTIIAGGDLTIQGTSVTMIPFFDGMWEIRVQSGGTLTVDQSTITSGTPFRYDFWIDQGSRANFTDSRILFAGYNGPMSSMGIHVSTDSIIFDGTLIQNGGMHGIYWDTPTPIATLNLNSCEIAWTFGHGIYIDDSAANEYRLQISGFSDIHDNGWSGVFFEQMGSKNLVVDVIDSRIANNGGGGIHVFGIAGGGDAFFTFQGSTISNNFGENLRIRQVNNGIVDIRAFGSNFDFSSVGAGIYVGQVGAGGSGGLSIRLDQSFVIGNGWTGVYVGTMLWGDLMVDITDTTVDRNGLLMVGDGVRLPRPAPGLLTSFSALRSDFNSNSGSGIFLDGSDSGSVRVGINTCTIQTNSDTGLYVGRIDSSNPVGLQMDVINSDINANGNPNGAIFLRGLVDGTALINIDDNDFNTSWAALFVDIDAMGWSFYSPPADGHTLTLSFTNNWVVSDWGEYGVLIAGAIRNFDETDLTFAGNRFVGLEQRDYGIYFAWPMSGDLDYWHNLTLNVIGNEFGALDGMGVRTDSIGGFRVVNINILLNVFWDMDFDYEYGFYSTAIYAVYDRDCYLNLIADSNQFYGMGEFSMRFQVYSIRHVYIDTSNNFFEGMGTTYSGVYFAQLRYGDMWDFSELTFLADNNEFVNMQPGAYGIYVNSAGQMFFRVTDFIFTNNFFNATASGSLYYGVYLTNSYYYSLTRDSNFNITLDNNDFLGLQINGLRLDGSVTEFRHVRLEYTNNLFENRGNIWLDYGVYHLLTINYPNLDVWSSLTVTIADNQCYDLNNDCIRFNSNVYGFRDVTISIERNIFENSVSNYIDYAVYFNNGIYYGSNMYDNTYSVTIRENTIRDVSGHGIYFSSGSAVYGFRHVDIQIHDNVIENLISPTYIGYGIYWYYEVYYSTQDYDSSINLDFTGNNFTDLDNGGIVFRNSAGWDFGYFRNASVNIQNNNFRNTVSSYMDYGIYLRTIYYGRTDADNSIDITVTGNTFDSLNSQAIYFYSGTGWDFNGYRNAQATIMDNRFINTLGNWMDYGVYLHGFNYGDDNFDNTFTYTLTDNTFSDLTQYGVLVHGQIRDYRHVDIFILDNIFTDVYNNFDRGVYFDNSFYGPQMHDAMYRLDILRNDFFDLNSYGVSFNGNIYNYRNASIAIQDNRFLNTINNYMDYGVYMQNVQCGDDTYDNYFDLTLLNNRFENLTNYGFRINQIFGYRHVTIDILSNFASDVYSNFDYAFMFSGSIYHNTAYDSTFTLTISGNTFMDLITRCIDFNGEIRDFRNVLITVDNNDFINMISNWMDGGVELGGIFYQSSDYDNSILIDITNNVFENLSYAGFRVTNQIYGYRHVTINVLDNFFSDVYNSFDYGVYFSSIYYTTDYDADVTISVLRNTFQDLSSRAVYFSGSIYNFRTTVITIEDNDFVGTISNWMDYGVDFSDIYYDVYDVAAYLFFNVTNNNFENITNRGLDVNEIYNMRYTYINILNNLFSDNYGDFDYGVYFNDGMYIDSPDFDSELILNYLNNEVRNLNYWGYGAYFSEAYNYRVVTVLVDNNDFISTQSGRTGYAIYFDGFYIADEMYDAYFNFDFTNNNIENLTYMGLYISYVENYRFTYIDAINNYMSDIYQNFEYGIYIDGCYIDSTDYYGEAFLNVLNNEFRDGDYWANAVYFYEFGNYHLTVVEIDNNDFISTSSNTLGYGVYFEYLYFDDDMYDTYLYFNATNNIMENLNGEGFTIYEIYGFRHVYIDFLDNSFTGQFNNFNTGIYFGEDTIYYSTNYDSDLTINILRNTFMDLSSRGVYFDGDIYDFRTVQITIDDNDFINTMGNWMDDGVYMSYIYYDNSNSDNYVTLDITNNDFHNLSSYGFRMSQIYYYRHVTINILNNQFSDIYNNFNYGIYFSNDIYHTRSFPGTFDLVVTNNFFNDLTTYAVRFNQIRNFEVTDILVADNDFSRSDYGFYINGGVDYAGIWDFEFARNNGDDMDSYILYLGGTSYGNDGDMATIWVHDNTMSNSWDGIYVDGLYYYDLSGELMIELNNLMDMKNGYGIELGWFYQVDNAYITIRDNTITGNMWAAIYFDGAEDMAYVLDIINNDLTGVQNAFYLEYPVYGDNMFTVGVININSNVITDLTGYGIYIDDVYYGLMDLNVDSNYFYGDPMAYYGVTFFYFDYAESNSISNIDFSHNVFEDGFYGFYFRYQTSGSMITLNMDHAYVNNTFYSFYFDDPISSSSDVFNIKIKKSIFDIAQLSFFYLDDPGYGLFIVDITDCTVKDYGSLGGYGFHMADNDGAYIQIDVHSTSFTRSSSSLGDAFAGDGQILINFWYISGITTGVSNGWNQRMQVLWDVDVQVYVGYDFTTQAGPGIIVYVADQFNYQSFYTTTNAGGAVLGETVAGTLITYTGTSFSGQAVHTFWATQGPFSGSAVGTFNANGTIAILLPGDNDGDGLHDGIDIDDDNDGVPDVYDFFPYDDNETKDTDGDGIGNNADDDDDGDGVPDPFDAFPENPTEWSDIDGDGVGDNADIDIDGDGIPNISDTSPYNNTGFQDSDGDGVADNIDAFPYSPTEWADNDGDGVGDNSDPDDDNDGVPDVSDLYPFDDSRTETRADEQVNIDINEDTDLITAIAILIIGIVILLLMWLLFGRKKKEEDEGVPPRPEEEAPPEEEEVPEEPEDLVEEEPEAPEEEERSPETDDEDLF